MAEDFLSSGARSVVPSGGSVSFLVTSSEAGASGLTQLAPVTAGMETFAGFCFRSLRGSGCDTLSCARKHPRPAALK